MVALLGEFFEQGFPIQHPVTLIAIHSLNSEFQSLNVSYQTPFIVSYINIFFKIWNNAIWNT